MDDIAVNQADGGRGAPVPAQLSDYEGTVSAHLQCFATFTARYGELLKGSGTPRGQQRALRALSIDLENVYAALSCARQQGALDCLLQIASGLGRYLDMTGNLLQASEVYGDLLKASRELGSMELELTVSSVLTLAQASVGTLGEARVTAQAALGLARRLGDPYGEAASLGNLGFISNLQGHYPQALELQSQALARRQELGDRWGQASALRDLAAVFYATGKYRRALELLSQALGIYRELGDQNGEGITLTNASLAHSRLGDNLLSLRQHGEALVLFRRQGNRQREAIALANLAYSHYIQGDYAHALRLQSEAICVYLELGDKRYLIQSIACSAAAMVCTGIWHAAPALYGGISNATRQEYCFDTVQQLLIKSGLDRLAASASAGETSAADLARWKSEGEAMSLDELAEFTLAALHEAQTEFQGKAELDIASAAPEVRA